MSSMMRKKTALKGVNSPSARVKAGTSNDEYSRDSSNEDRRDIIAYNVADRQFCVNTDCVYNRPDRAEKIGPHMHQTVSYIFNCF